MTDAAIWALTAAAPDVDAPARQTLADALASRRQHGDGWMTIVTCHRVEAYGTGPAPELGAAAAGAALLRDEAAIRHLCRLATGLESVVLGEHQIVHQLRAALRTAGPDVDPVVLRAWQTALWAARRARAGRGRERGDLGELALEWLDQCLGPIDGRAVLVVGAGAMGQAIHRAASRRRMKVTAATRSPGVDERTAGMLDLASAARRTAGVDAVVIALAGPWHELDAVVPERGLPPVVDLSFPSAVSPAVARRLGDRFVDVDGLGAWATARRADTRMLRWSPAAVDERAGYRRSAERLVDEAVARMELWLAARPSADAIRSLRERAEAERRRVLARLYRRLPELEPRERELVGALSHQLVAALLHEPTAALRADRDGSAAAAARQLFGP